MFKAQTGQTFNHDVAQTCNLMENSVPLYQRTTTLGGNFYSILTILHMHPIGFNKHVSCSYNIMMYIIDGTELLVRGKNG